MPSGREKSLGMAGKVFVSVLLVFFLAVGGFLTWALGHVALSTVEVYGWRATPCRVLNSELRTGNIRDEPFRFVVQYEYEVDGRPYESDRYRRSYAGGDWVADVERLVDKYQTGTTAACLVNPKDASEAVLERESLWLGLLPLGPLVLVVTGAVILLQLWRKESSKRVWRFLSRGAAATFILSGMLIGGVGLWLLVLKPVLKTVDARDWPEVPCVVASSKVRQGQQDDKSGFTWIVDILYEYEWQGRLRRSNQYGWHRFGTSGYDAKKRIVDAHPAGLETVCYVNPDDANEAVLNRGLGLWMLLGLIPLIFFLLAFFLMVEYVSAWVKRSRHRH